MFKLIHYIYVRIITDIDISVAIGTANGILLFENVILLLSLIQTVKCT